MNRNIRSVNDNKCGGTALENGKDFKATISWEPIIFLLIFIGFFGSVGSKMGVANMLNTILNTAYDLLINTVFYIMAIAVVTGALSGLLIEFGVVAALNKILSPLMKPLYGLPGAAIVGIMTTYLSDNPAILTLAHDKSFRSYFKKYQLPAITNIGTAFGMGMIITTFMIGIKNPYGGTFISEAVIGNIGAIIGSIVSTRLMLIKTKKIFGVYQQCENTNNHDYSKCYNNETREKNVFNRIMNAALEGGKKGVSLGVTIIPGVIIICTLVLLLTKGPSESGTFTGASYEGISVLPMLAEKLQFILKPLFGFVSSESIVVPVTALGSAGAAIGLVPELVQNHLATGNDIAVFTAVSMCWSGYLSTHVAMMDSLNFRDLTGHAILSHTIGGVCAGISAHIIYFLVHTL